MVVLLEGHILAMTVYKRSTLLARERFEGLDDRLGTIRCWDGCILSSHV